MAASAWTVYSNAALGISDKAMNLGSDAFQIILLTNSYTPNVATDTTYGNISANEVASGSGYTAGGIALTSISNTLTSNTVTFTCANPTWAAFSATLRYGAIVHMAGGSLVSGDLLLAYSDFTGGGSVTGAGGSFVVTINAAGVFTITHSP